MGYLGYTSIRESSQARSLTPRNIYEGQSNVTRVQTGMYVLVIFPGGSLFFQPHNNFTWNGQ